MSAETRTVGNELGVAVEPTIAAWAAAHYPRLVRLAALVCDNATDAEDAVQTAFEQAWRRRDSLREAAALRGWLNRIVVREAIRIQRRRTSFVDRVLGGPREVALDLERHDQPGSQPGPELRTALRIAYAELSPALRAVVGLHLYAGYSMQETADILAIPLETARSRLRLARERLRARLEEGRA